MAELCVQRRGEGEPDARAPFAEPDAETTRCYEELRPILLNMMTRRLGNPSDAEDLAQEVFIRLCRVMREGRPPHHVRDWAFAVARNLMTDLERRRRRVARRERQPPDDVALSVPCSGATPEQAFAMAERHQRLRLAWRTLTTREREYLLLRARGCVLREIADTAQIALSWIATSIQQATKKLQMLVDADEPRSAGRLGSWGGPEVSVRRRPRDRATGLQGSIHVDARAKPSRSRAHSEISDTHRRRAHDPGEPCSCRRPHARGA